MNKTERQMADILRAGAESSGYVAVKAEFEAEGTRMDELLRLVDIAHAAGLPLTVKIGGCEAIRDLLESKQVGVRYVVAPMVESAYALSKYIAAKENVFTVDEQLDTDFLFNMETIGAYEVRKDLIELSAGTPGVNGIVFGRVDFAGSLGLGRDGVNSAQVTDCVLDVAQRCKDANLDLVMGGAISVDSLDIVKQVREVYLTRFETRKVVFDGAAATNEGVRQGLLNAVHFELLWLLNKREYYGTIHREDDKRIDMLESRWKLLNQ